MPGIPMLIVKIALLTILLSLIHLFAVGKATATNQEVVNNLLESYFYDRQTLQESSHYSFDKKLEYIKRSGSDPWIKIVPPDVTVDSLINKKSDAFGLQLFLQDDAYYLIPSIDSPNESATYEAFRVVDAPTDDDWVSGLRNGDITIKGKTSDFRFKKAVFNTTDFKISNTSVRIDNFTNPELKWVFKEYRNELAQAQTIDLRFNGGGSLDVAASLLSAILGENTAFGKIERVDETKFYGPKISSNAKSAKNISIVISRHTASAAEWVARVMQQYGATVYGERSVGKCLVHRVFPAGQKKSISFAVGLVRVHDTAGYDYCNFGVVPNVHLDSDLLFTLGAVELVNTAESCLNKQIGKSASKSVCQKLVSGFKEPMYISDSSPNLPSTNKTSISQKTNDKVSSTRGAKTGVIQNPAAKITTGENSEDSKRKHNKPFINKPKQTANATDKENIKKRLCVASEWSLKVASFETRAEAEKLVDRLTKLALEGVARIRKVDTDDNTFYSVVLTDIVGRYRLEKIKIKLDEEFSVDSIAKRIVRANAFIKHINVSGGEFADSFSVVGQIDVCMNNLVDESEVSQYQEQLSASTGLNYEARDSQ